ncbi:galactose mutarotase [Streptomyces calidiresistens]
MGGVRDDFGRTPDGTPVRRHTLRAHGITAAVLTYGCVIQSLRVPDARGDEGGVVIGLGSMEDYVARSRYFGAVVGRYGNRIARARFALDGREYRLPRNHGRNGLHGGPQGFDKRVWEAVEVDESRIVLERVSPDGEMGYPGELRARVTYTLVPGTDGGELRIDYHAVTDAPTHVNLTNHSYFNLAGGGTVDDHELTLDADRFLPVDEEFIPDGKPEPVADTPFDFTRPHRIGERIADDHPQLKVAGGYDHCYVFRAPAGDGTPVPVARVTEPTSGRIMLVSTTEPGVQFYSGNMLADAEYGRGSGLCLETQHFPDSPNRPDFPSTVLRPGEEYTSTTVYRFTAGRPTGEAAQQWP